MSRPPTMHFVLHDLFPQLFERRGPNQPDQPQVAGVGHVYTGDEPPMAWVQREQRHASTASTTDTQATSNACREKGNEAFRAGNLQEAMSQYTQAIELDPTNELNYSNRSLLNFKLGEFNAAAEDARMSISINSNFYKAHFRLAQAFAGLKQYQLALQSFQAALELVDESQIDVRQDIQKEIAKCESRLARTPLAPPSDGVPFGTPLAPTAQDTCFPSPEGKPPIEEATHSDPLFEAVEKNIPNMDIFNPITEKVEAARDAVQRMKSAEKFVSIASTCYCSKKDKRMKELFVLSDPDKISKLAEEASAAQDQLRTAVASGDRNFFTDSLNKRDELYGSLWGTAHSAIDAVEELLAMSTHEQRATGDVDALRRVYKEDALRSSGIQPLTASEVPTAVDEYRELNRALQPEMAELTARVNADLVQLKKSAGELAEAVAKHKAQFDRAENIAQQLALTIQAPPQNAFTPQRIEALTALQPRLKRLIADESSFTNSTVEGSTLLQREAELERERLRLERTRIQLQAELEWLAVKEDDDLPKTQRLRKSLENSQEEIKHIVQEQEAVQRRILGLIDTEHPELAWNSAAGGKRIMKWVKGSGLWINAAFSDFTIVSTLASTANSKVYHVRSRRGAEKALKEIPMENDKIRKRFQNEVNIMTSVATHPNVLKIEGVFFDGPFAYILMPLHKKGNLKKVAAETTLPQYKLQEIFRQIVSGVAYLHEHGIVHGDIKPSNILITDDFKPIVTDFGVAKDIGRFGEKDITMTTTGRAIGTSDFMAPEQLGGDSKAATTRSDMWSLGMCMYAVASQSVAHEREVDAPSLPVLIPPAERVVVEGDAVGNERLADLIQHLLVADPQKRMVAPEVLAHPFLCVSLVEDMMQNRQLVESNGKLEAFRTYLHALRSGHRHPVMISVVRNQMVESISSVFQQLEDAAVLRPIFVVFRGEDGIDEGALTTEMFYLYFQQAVSKHRILVTPTSGQSSESDESAGSRANFSYGAEYVVSDDPRIPTQSFVTLGRVLLKCIIENRPLPMQLNSSVLKYLLGVDPTLHDLEEYDRTLAQNLRRLLLLPADELAAMDMNFDEFPDEFAGNLANETVTTANIQAYVDMKIRYELVGKREKQLKAVKSGFEMSSALQPHLQLLSPIELQMLLCGQQHIDASTIINSIEFAEFPPGSRTPEHLKELLQTFSQYNLKRFLRLCTASVSIPTQGLPRKIKVIGTGDPDRLPVGHSCAFQLDLPDYNNMEKLKEKLGVTLAHVNEGFFIV